MTHFIRFKKSTEYIRFDAPELLLSGNAFLPTTALVPLLQHDGIGSKPVVTPGEHVHEGQIIARGLEKESAHIHSPIPGTVAEFKNIPMPDGSVGISAVINLSGSFDILGRKEANFPWRTVPESELLRVIEDKGIINTFETPVPLAPQLRNAKKKGHPILVVRLFDNDPTCQLDSFLVKNFLDVILEGCALLAKSIDADAVFLVHTEKKWSGPNEKKFHDVFSKRTVTTLRSSDRYPSGNSGQFQSLMKTVHSIDKDTPMIFIEPVTAYSVYEAVVKNKPMINRFIVVTGPALDTPSVLNVRIGTPIGDIIEECGGFKTAPSRIIVNGLLCGQAVYDLDTPITKYTKSLHIMDAETCPSYTVRNCIHCGRCLQVCPVSIDPQRIVTSIQKEKITPKLLASISACQYCGCCAIVCPSRIPLHHIIREADSRLKGNGI